jgi:DNA repair protein RadC
MSGIKDLPSTERPREKLLGQGCKNLSNSELLALIIGSGTTESSALSLAAKVLSHFDGGIVSLKEISPEELMQIKGIGEATAARILAAAEFGTRISSAGAMNRNRIICPEDVAGMFSAEFAGEKQEYLYTVLLNSKHEMIGKELVAKGGITSSPAVPQDVFRPAVRRGASGIILVHNHPSGDPSPSEDDYKVTQRISEAGTLIGIKLVDHVVVGGGGGFSSLKASGMMNT